MDVITALYCVLHDDEMAALRDQLLLPLRAQLAPNRIDVVDVAALIRALEEIAVGDYPEAVKAAILPHLTALREMKGFGLMGYGRIQKGDDESTG